MTGPTATAGMGTAGMHDLSSRPHSSPRRTPAAIERQTAFPDCLDRYDHRRPRTGIGGPPPAGRSTNLS
ncbi:hypothetical protein GCM10010448_37240 [Streptomyces glomeratus]|uniref:Uncharacterized protein n=1 Tax=Streptomyces glomeratus TaxID=284452 RepID=A0ABP6LS55_9ACTN